MKLAVFLLSGLAFLFCLPGVTLTDTKRIESQRVIFSDYFTAGNDEEWTQLNRSWQVVDGHYLLDGGYLPDATGRDGFAVTHVGDERWLNYTMTVTFDNSNPPGLPTPDVHQAIFFVRVNSQPPQGTYYRIDVWAPGVIDPRVPDGAVLSRGLTAIYKIVDGSLIDFLDREFSNSTAGTNTISIEVRGNRVVISINGAMVIEFRDPEPIPGGGIGIGAIWEAEAWFDNVVVAR